MRWRGVSAKIRLGKAVANRLVGGAAVACLVIGCGYTVYSNIIAASVYPTLGTAGYDEPVVRQPKVATRSIAQRFAEVFAALPEPRAGRDLCNYV